MTTCEKGRPYPSGEKSDLFIETSAGERAYCEIRRCTRSFFRRERRPYPAYLWSPFQNPSKEHSAGFDLAKLATLPDPNTTHVALIVIGSSLPVDRMDLDFDKFAHMAKIDVAPWESYRDYWPNQWHSGYFYDLRVWGCEMENVPKWWASIADVFRPYGY